jgi:ABC-type multidrug transport system ATPase subunit
MNTLEFDSLYLEFGSQRILSGVHMVCRTGNIVGLLGRNGSGKSCLMKIVFGVLPAEFKSIRFNGTALTDNYLSRKLIGYLPQDDMIPSFITLKDAVNLFGVDRHLEKIYPMWKDVRERRSGELSGGQKRLLEVLMILYAPHPFCILDEPFSGLAPVQIELLAEEMRRVKTSKGIIITDHLHRHVRAAADDLYVLANGQTRKVSNDQQLIEWGYLAQ